MNSSSEAKNCQASKSHEAPLGLANINMWPHNLYETWLLSLPALIPYMVMMSLKMMERKTPFTSETFLHEYDYIVGK